MLYISLQELLAWARTVSESVISLNICILDIEFYAIHRFLPLNYLSTSLNDSINFHNYGGRKPDFESDVEGLSECQYQCNYNLQAGCLLRSPPAAPGLVIPACMLQSVVNRAVKG